MNHLGQTTNEAAATASRTAYAAPVKPAPRTDNEKAAMNAMRIVGEYYGMADRMDGYHDVVLVADVAGILHETTDLNDGTITETLAALIDDGLIDCRHTGPDGESEWIHFTAAGQNAWDADAKAQDTPHAVDIEEETAQVDRMEAELASDATGERKPPDSGRGAR